jgi:peptidoglycan/LPS O-acetylase OafA/YrhL
LITLSVGMFLTAWSPEHFPSELWGHKAVLYAWPWLLGFLLGSLNRRKSAFWLSLAATAVVHFGPFGSEDQYRAITWLGVMGVLFYGGRIELPFWVRRIFNYLGELSFPLYLFHVPFALFFYSLAGIHRPWTLVGCVLGWVAVFNLIFDHWLKSWFWKPLVSWVTERFPKRDCQTTR